MPIHDAYAGAKPERPACQHQRRFSAISGPSKQHDYAEVIACFAEDAVVVHPIFGRQPAAGFFESLFAKTTADKLTVKTIFHSPDNPATAAVLFFDEWSSADGTEFKNDIVLIFDFDRDDRVRKLTVVFDTFPVRGKL